MGILLHSQINAHFRCRGVDFDTSSNTCYELRAINDNLLTSNPTVMHFQKTNCPRKNNTSSLISNPLVLILSLSVVVLMVTLHFPQVFRYFLLIPGRESRIQVSILGQVTSNKKLFYFNSMHQSNYFLTRPIGHISKV